LLALGLDRPAGVLPATTRRVVDAVRAGRAGGLFPPVVEPGPDGTLTPHRDLSGPADADAVAGLLTSAAGAPLRAALDDLDRWCARATRRYADVLAPKVLDVTNGALFGPLVAGVLGGDGTAAADRYRDFLALFLDRLRQDLGSGWPAAPELAGPVVGLLAHGEEAHNGGQRVLRLELAGGGRVAYKPRPASGEPLFLAAGDGTAPGSVFDLLNGLPPASGPVRLPVLRCWTGGGTDRHAYQWQEWIERPPDQVTLREQDGRRLRGARLDRPDSFWHRAGSLAAACFAFGIADLYGSNVPVGVRYGERDPLPYPVDLEIYFTDVRRLYGTGLIHHPDTGGHHHVGFEHTPRWCAEEGPPYLFRDTPTGLHLHRRHEPLTRLESRTVVADPSGRTGYAHHLPAMLRGMFDAWTLLCRHRATVATRLRHDADRRYVRVLRHPTATYVTTLAAHGPAGGTGPSYDEDELSQLARGDVPYFFRTETGGPLLSLAPPPHRGTVTALPVLTDPSWPPVQRLRTGEGLTLAGLGAALRDAVEYVLDDLPDPDLHDPRYGVHLHTNGPDDGLVSFDWPSARRRVTYTWTGSAVRLGIDPLDSGPQGPGGMVSGTRQRLENLDRVDARLREPWAVGGFRDRATEERLQTLTGSGIRWLLGVAERDGWPVSETVGADAAAAASRLVQHAAGHRVAPPAALEGCLAAMTAAAEAGRLAWREVAYVADALDVTAGRPQRYGTKFERRDGELVPFELDDPDLVDARRAELGLDPIVEYAAALRDRFTET
jgi:hypothetical protein